MRGQQEEEEYGEHGSEGSQGPELAVQVGPAPLLDAPGDVAHLLGALWLAEDLPAKDERHAQCGHGHYRDDPEEGQVEPSEGNPEALRLHLMHTTLPGAVGAPPLPNGRGSDRRAS